MFALLPASLFLVEMKCFISLFLHRSKYGVQVSLFALSYAGQTSFGLDHKVALGIAQCLGYAMGKMTTMIWLPRVTRQWQAVGIAMATIGAFIPLLFFSGFASTREVQTVAVFISAIPLGWVCVSSFGVCSHRYSFVFCRYGDYCCAIARADVRHLSSCHC